MSDRRPRLAIVLLAAAVVVELLAAGGWLAWRRVERRLATEPAAGAALLARGALLALPAAVARSRRLQVGDLAGVDPQTTGAALARLGSLQRRWEPTDPDGWRNVGLAALLEGDVDVGRVDLEQAIRRDPTSPYLHRLLALLLRLAGQSAEFLDHMAMAEAIAAGFSSPPVELTPEDTRWVRREALRRRIGLYPSRRVQGLLALAEEVRREEGEDAAMATLRGIEGEPEVDLQVARWELAYGRPSETARRAEALAQRTALPTRIRVSAWSLLAEARDASGDAEGARAAAAEALRLGPGSPAPYLTLAALAERRQDWPSALENARRAWGIAPADLHVVLRFASVAEKAGSTADARFALRRALELAPERPDVAAALVEHLLRTRDYMEATMALSRALDRFPTDARLIALTQRLRQDVSRFRNP
jgi:Flp pilus assembly protein TadD